MLNSERTLERCIKSIAKQDYPFIEILVIDGGSTDNTLEIARKFGAKTYFLRRPLGEARQLGIDVSSGELVALWDSDVYIVHPKWLSQSVSMFSNFPEASTLWIRTIPPANATNVAKAYDWYSWSIMLNFASKGIGIWGGGISIFKKSALENVGGITKEVDTGEDYDLAKKLTTEGYSVLFYHNPVYHDTHTNIRELVLKDIRRAMNFKKIGLASSTGIPLSELVKTNLKIGLFLSIKNLITRKETYFGIVPVIVLLRLLVYTVAFLL